MTDKKNADMEFLHRTVHLKAYTENLLTLFLLSRIVVIASDIIYGLGVCLISELFAVCFGWSFVFIYQPL
jgi:hypothetical protein